MKLAIILTEFEFSQSLKKLAGVEPDQVGDIIEKLDSDQLTDLVDACNNNDSKAVREIIGGATESNEENGADEEQFSPLLSPKDKLKAQAKKKLRSTQVDKELGEDTDSVKSFGIGDTVWVNGEEATVKIPSAPGDTVGVMIDGELKMVEKSKVNLDEGVLGMTAMPGFKTSGDSDLQRIRELAGIRGEDSFDAPEPAEFPAEPEGAMEPEFDSGLDGGMEAPEADVPALPAPTPSPVNTMPATASMAPPMPGAMDGEEDSKVALDNAINEIENLIPNVTISEYKTLVARLKALVSMAESAGKAALTESQKKRVAEGFGLSVAKNFKGKDKPKGFEKGGEVEKSSYGSKQQPGQKGFGRGKYAESNVAEDKISPKAGEKKPEAETDEEDGEVTRKTLMDYLKETDGLETLGNTRQDAMRNIQNRLGPSASPQQASQAFTAMFGTGHIKQQNGRFMMPTTDDETFRTQVAQAGPSDNTANTTTSPNDEQGQGVNSQTGPSPSQTNTKQTSNNQGGANPAYQGS